MELPNFEPIASYDIELQHLYDLKSKLLELKKNIDYAGSWNLSFGFYLFNMKTDDVMHYDGYNNSRVYDVPVFVGSDEDMKRLLESLRKIDLYLYAKRQRHSKVYQVDSITNVIVYIDKCMK